MKNKFGEIISSLGLPQDVADSIVEAWDAQVEQNRKDLKAELVKETASSDMDYVVAAAETIMNEALESHKNEIEAERKAIAEAKQDALSKVRKAKKLFEAAKKAKVLKESSESMKLESVSKFVSDVLAKEIKELREDRERLANEISAEKVALLKQRMNAQKIAETHAKAATKLLVESLQAEIKELHEDRAENKKILESRLQEMEKIMEGVLSSEMQELKEDRQNMMEAVAKLEDLTVRQLTEELSEFQEDKRMLKEERTRLELDAKRKIQEFKEEFVSKTSEAASRVINETLTGELNSLRKGLKEARENTFGRKIFEAFVGEFTTSVFNQNTTAQKLLKKLEESNKNIEKLQKIVTEQEQTLNKKEKALTEAISTAKREKVVSSLVSSLGGVQKRMMLSLLESVETDKLEKEFNRYLPQVLERKIEPRKVISESAVTKHLKESNGNRVQRESVVVENINTETVETENFVDIEKIIASAGLAKKNS